MDVELLGKLVEWAIYTMPADAIRDACDGHYAPYYHLVYLLAKRMAPCVIVELGVHFGRFLHCAALASADNVIFGVDTLHQQPLDAVLSVHDNIVFINASSMPGPARKICGVGKIDILHIDTVHTYGQARGEFDAYKHLLSDGAVVMFDDLHDNDDDVLRFFKELPYPKIHDDRLHPANVHNPCGYGVMVYTDTEDLQDENSIPS